MLWNASVDGGIEGAEMTQDLPGRRGTVSDTGFRALVFTQFLTTFNDNAFRVSIILLATSLFRDQKGTESAITSVSTALFLLPYALLSLLAGRFSDRYSKGSIFRFWKIAEIPMIAIGMLGLMSAAPGVYWPIGLMLVMLFGLGTQTSFLGPARYGMLPEILDEKQLSQGNGDLELGSYTGILLGTIMAAPIAEAVLFPDRSRLPLLLMPLAALVGALCSFFIPQVPASNPKQDLWSGLNPKTFLENWRILKSHRGLTPTVWGLTLFWGMSTLFLLNTPNFGTHYLGYTNPSDVNTLVVAISIGIGLGSWLAGKLSVGGIELGLVPIGTVIWFLAAMGLTMTGAFGHVALDDGTVVELFWPPALFLGLAGFGAGMYIVPLNAFLERYTHPENRASCIATSNIVTVLGMLAACLLNYTFASVLQLSPKVVFFSAGILLLVAAWWVLRLLPDFFVRLMIFFMTRATYKIRTVGEENVPAHGPALLVFNHVSFADGNLVGSCFRRFVRFVVYKAHTQLPILGWLTETMQAIPVDSEGPPKEIIHSLRQASEVLNRGELLCIFAEGSITRTGFMMPFRRGFEQILKRAKPDVPIVPGYIDGMWGSIFSYQRGKFFWKWPREWRYPVTIAFGKPMSAKSTAEEVREQVQLLGVDCAKLRKSVQRPLPREFLRKARHFRRRPAFADTTTPMITFGDAIARSVVLSRLLKRKLGPAEYVGLLLPPAVGGALANIALTYLGKIPVNLNYTVGVGVIEQCIEQCGIKQMLTSRKFMEKVQLQPAGVEIVYLEDLRSDLRLGDKIAAAAAKFSPVWIVENLILKLPHKEMDDIATIIFSSGSTGEPKGVMLTHQNICANVDSISQSVDATEQDTLLGVLPFFHSFGFTGTIWLPALIGAATVYHYNPLEAETVGELARKFKATLFLSTATFLRGYIRKCEVEDFKSVRLIVCGAEKLPMQVADQFEKKFGVRPMEGYGCTELSPAVSTNRPDIVHGNVRQVAHKPGTIGHPMPGQAVRVVDPETRERLPNGQEGMLLVNGANVMKGYLHKPEMTAQVIHDGWYTTGDIAKIDDDGFITITDRLSRFSKIAGEMVPHGKVEDKLHEILQTHERMCTVVGVPDLRKGERLVVIHTPLPMPVDELWGKLKDSGLPPIYLPAKFAFFEIPEMPILGTGKVDLKQVKIIAHEKLKDAAA